MAFEMLPTHLTANLEGGWVAVRAACYFRRSIFDTSAVGCNGMLIRKTKDDGKCQLSELARSE